MRLFVAVVPPAGVLDAVAALPRPEHRGVRWTARDQWHVTLQFLGEVDRADVLVASLDAIAVPPAPEVVLGPETAALNRSVLCVPAAGLDPLARAVHDAAIDAGCAVDDRGFRGHLTLARVRDGSARRLAGVPIDASWVASTVDLVRSHLHPDGARDEVIHQRAL